MPDRHSQDLRNGHGNGVWLFACRTARGPDSQLSSTSRSVNLLKKGFEDVLLQVLEVMFLAEEAGQVGRDRIDHVGRFLTAFVRMQQRTIIAEGRKTQRAEPSRQSAVYEIHLVARQDDAATVVDQF